jgi:hypothetical protein
MSENKELEIKKEASPVHVIDMYADMTTFGNVYKMANMLAQSQIVPTIFQGNASNCMIAIELSARMHSSPLMVMQNLYIVHGNPSFSAKFIIAMINQSKEFSRLKFEFTGEGKTRSCTATATELATGEKLIGPKITWKMAEDEKWTTKSQSKWQTMPDVMFQYRAATFWARMYVPDMLMGMYTTDEVVDMDDLQDVSVVDKPVDIVDKAEKVVEEKQATETLKIEPDKEEVDEPSFMKDDDEKQIDIDDDFPEIK